MTHAELQEQIKDAMKARDKVRLAILRQVHGELKDIEIDRRHDTTEEDVSNTSRVIKQTSETTRGEHQGRQQPGAHRHPCPPGRGS